jgi:four helix bundle protein
MRDFRKIKAWQLADDLAVLVYEVTKGFPRSEAYGLTSQVRRVAVSVAANIVEGASRETAKDYIHFLHIARGSLAETQYPLHLAKRLGFLGEEEFSEANELSRQTFACLHGLLTAVRAS